MVVNTLRRPRICRGVAPSAISVVNYWINCTRRKKLYRYPLLQPQCGCRHPPPDVGRSARSKCFCRSNKFDDPLPVSSQKLKRCFHVIPLNRDVHWKTHFKCLTSKSKYCHRSVRISSLKSNHIKHLLAYLNRTSEQDKMLENWSNLPHRFAQQIECNVLLCRTNQRPEWIRRHVANFGIWWMIINLAGALCWRREFYVGRLVAFLIFLYIHFPSALNMVSFTL